MRKKLFYALIGIFVIQLLVPAYMIIYSVSYESKIENNGKEYYIHIEPYGVNDKNEVTFHTYGCEYINDEKPLENTQYIYALLDVDSEGIAYVDKITYEKPETPYYIRTDEPYIKWNFPDISYKTDSQTGTALSNYIKNKYNRIWSSQNNDEPVVYDTYYARVFVYEGKIIVKDILLNGTPIEEYFKNS